MILFKILLLILLAAPVIAFAFFLFIQVLKFVNKLTRMDNQRGRKRDIYRSNERRPRL